MSIGWVLWMRYVVQPSGGFSDVTAINIFLFLLCMDVMIGFNIWKEWT